MGIELEPGVLLGLFVVGEGNFGPFEAEPPAWNKITPRRRFCALRGWDWVEIGSPE